MATLLKRQAGWCAGCGLYFQSEDKLEVDHIISTARGGRDSYDNWQLLHVIEAYEWDLDDDGTFDDASGPTPTFTMVGQDGSFPVDLRVTDALGATDTDESTVTVNNIAPSVSLSSDAPVDENSAVTVSGAISDPGWLESLTATIDWGDGTPPENIAGTVEKVRPDATLPMKSRQSR